MFNRKLLILIVVMLLLNVIVPFAVFAQDAPTQVIGTPFSTVEQADMTIVSPTLEPTTAPVQTPVNVPELFGSIFTLLAIVTSVFVGGTLSVVAVLEFLRRKDVRDTSERLFLSTPPETQKMIADLVVSLDEARKTAERIADGLLEFFKSTTDGLPNADSAAIQQLRADLKATQSQVMTNTANIAQAAGLDGRP